MRLWKFVLLTRNAKKRQDALRGKARLILARHTFLNTKDSERESIWRSRSQQVVSFLRSGLITLFIPGLVLAKDTISPTLLVEADYVIIGAGTSGATLAAKLSDRDPKTGKFKNRVLVLEAGVNLTTDSEVLASNLFATTPLAFDPKYSKMYTPLLMDDVEGPYTDGRMWGGSSGHNGLQAYRGTPSLYNQWAAISQDNRWLYKKLLKNVMKKMEHYTPNGTTVDRQQRGTKGPLFITQEPPLNTDPFMIAVSKGTNAPLVDDLNDPTLGDVGIGANQDWVTPPFLGPKSIRSFSGNSYLRGIPGKGIKPIVTKTGFGRKGRLLRVVSNAVVSRIVFDDTNTATSVEFILSESSETVRSVKVNKKVIVCAGAIQDAAILQRSGIGDQSLLQSLGIPVVFDNPNVGANMQNHYGPEAIIGGPVTGVSPPRVGSGFIDLSPFMSPGVRRYQLFMTNAFFFFPAGISSALGITSGSVVAGTNVTPQSTGLIQIVSQSPFDDPRINMNFYSDGPYTTPGTDAYKAVAFYKIMQSVAAANGGTVLYPPPADYAAGDAALFNDAVNTNFYAYHFCGTCRMGSSPENGVVDSKLNVFGVSNVMVASCSVAPVINDGNTAYIAFVIGLEAARILGAP